TAPRGRSPGLHLSHESRGQARAIAALAVARGAWQKYPYRWRHGILTVYPSTIPLVYYHIKSFQQASSVERPWWSCPSPLRIIPAAPRAPDQPPPTVDFPIMEDHWPRSTRMELHTRVALIEASPVFWRNFWR